jgi:hypothetical protein
MERITTDRRVSLLAAAFGVLALLAGPAGAWALDVSVPAAAGAIPGAGNLAPAVREAAAAPPAEATVQGTNPHGQGTVLAVSVAGKEAVVVGRSRGEQRTDGTYHGHNTTLGLLGQDVIANDTGPGATAKGPLAPVQEQVLDQVCKGSSGNVCVDVLRADSSTTTTGSKNHQRVAGLTLGGANGLSLVAADSNGDIESNGDCQTAHGDVTLLKLMLGGNPLIDLGESATDSNACPSGTTVKNSTNPLIAIGGQEIPLPGCGANSPGYLLNADPLLAIACNAASNAGAGGLTNTGLVGTVLTNGGTPTAMLTGADTGAAAQAPAQAVLAERQASPARTKAGTKPGSGATSTGAKGGKKPSRSGVPAAAKTPRPFTAAKVGALPYTGTDLLVVIIAAASLFGMGAAMRAVTRRRWPE